ncbi:MAG TPA: GGDEF domain-containing protein [Candidatus Dormibacteraeota bacterium]|nr:GGDEF domain-containing protein [Candidatus Dormibacteraeota bacterium]
MLDTNQPAFWGDDAAGRRAIGRIAGILFSAGGLATVPAYRLMEDPSPPAAVNLLPFLAFVSGIVCFLVPWERLRAGWVHLVPALGSVEVAFSMWVLGRHGNVVAWFFVFVVVFAALAFHSHLQVAGHVLFAAVLLAAPIIYAPDSARDNLIRAIVAVPTLAVAAAVVAYLRERLEFEQEVMRRLALHDPLTGVGNYRLLYERLDYEITRHARYNRRFAIALLDLNSFKQVNDAHGHLAGDQLLQDVGHALTEAVRGQDTVARQGGDEFAVLAPESGPVDALALTKRLQRALRKIRVGDLPLTTSIGYAVFP